ncbi:MAG: class IV adenylate cyclase [Tissierellia bacterium]|nr:class IV adenylate cyclase [Tissierellia bacterium]
MSKEIEVKVLNVDLEDMENKLIKLNAELISEEEQHNIIFHAKEKTKALNPNTYLRIRESKNLLTDQVETKLTLKENRGNVKIRENMETTTSIDNVESMIYILENLGYEISSDGRKHRKSYLYENIRFDLDTWDKNTYPYPYMEIEVEDPKDLNKAVDLLEISPNNISTKSIMELKKEL